MNDQDLVQRLLGGEPQAKEELAALYYRRLYATACHVLGHRDEEVEDVVQDSFAAAFKALDRFEGRSSLYTWLNHICVNQCFDRLRQRRKQLLMESASLELLMQPKAQSAQQDAEAEAIKEERLGRLKALLAALGEPCGELLRWRYQQGLSLNEIKERLRAPLGTVTARLYRCLSALRRQAEGSLS